MENNEFAKVCIKNNLCYIDNIIKLEDFELDILIDEKSCKSILIYNNTCRTVIGPKSLQIKFNTICKYIRIYDETRYKYYLVLKNMMLFTTELDIL